jgi:hypothetical protein
MEERVEALEREIAELKKVKTTTNNCVEKKEKKTRAPSAYNEFMKTELAKIKLTNPEMSHKEKFKLAASRYSAKNQANKA